MSGLALAISHRLLRLYPARYSQNRFRFRRKLLWKLFKTAVQQGRSERRGEAYAWYVEP